jgi:hypothetical protein
VLGWAYARPCESVAVYDHVYDCATHAVAENVTVPNAEPETLVPETEIVRPEIDAVPEGVGDPTELICQPAGAVTV